MPSTRRRIVDISPPGIMRSNLIQPLPAAVQQPKELSKQGRGGGKLLLAGLLALLGGFGMMHVFFAKAQVIIEPQAREAVLQETVRILPGLESVQPISKSIPGYGIEQTLQDTQLFAALSKEKRSDKATGTIRVYNTQRKQQTLIANTRFLSESNKLFKIFSQIRVPAARADGSPGVLDVKVVAAEAGSEYNIGPSSFALPGLAGSPLYTQVYAKSFQPMTGGRIEEVTVVGEDDIERAKELLVASLKRRALEQVQLPPGFRVDPALVSVEVLSASTPVLAGAELREFNVSAEIKVAGLAFRMEDLRLLAKEILATNLQADEELDDELEVNYEKERIQEEVLLLDMTARAYAYKKVDQETLKQQIQGLKGAVAEQVLADYLSIARAQVSLWPFWVQSVPGDGERIRIELHLDENETL